MLVYGLNDHTLKHTFFEELHDDREKDHNPCAENEMSMLQGLQMSDLVILRIGYRWSF